MKTKIRVHGKSQSRTALGIINAYLMLYPDTTPYQLQQAFPKSLNSRCTTDNLIVPIEETLGNEKVFFEQEDETIVFKSGERYALVEVWGKEDFEAICKRAKHYGIVVAKKGTKPFEKGSFTLEYLNERCWCKTVCWLLLLIILLLLLLIFFWKKCSSDTCSDKNVTAVECNVGSTDREQLVPAPANGAFQISETDASVTVTSPDGKVLDITKNSQEFKLFSFLNSAAQVDADKTKGWMPLDRVQFETGKAQLTPECENQLQNIAAILQFFPNAHLKVGGYTDDTGTDEANMKLSHERAKVTAEKLINFGMDENRITFEGYGSKHPVSPDNDIEGRAANRRVDIRVTRK